MADLLKVMERECLHSEHAAQCFLEAKRRDKTLRAIASEIAGRRRPDPCKGDSNSGRWVTLTLPRELLERLDEALLNGDTPSNERANPASAAGAKSGEPKANVG